MNEKNNYNEAEEFFQLIIKFREQMENFLNSQEANQLFSEGRYKDVEDGLLKLRKEILDDNKITQKVLLTGYLDTLINRHLLIKILGILHNIEKKIS
ncbi:MAG: hypothetical protein DRN29_01465 [Thermoplasmata archaeon]|nr:MAG: hypothetical protein DRN29_01465 [Thermoplasmata archaeon]